ncbi:hypothetical protein A3740_17220 [Oleiphilus sp. HI0068]|uniref:hypothetical protein n=1 Tax=Oleiphilus sp. HI0132 TaxID=1822270 RepID=UPI0007C284DF|nr:hypothetical protein [Oleiphilus sp. HI0132]KZY74211.1 hypothetical protein A3740_17220 [Oleiphilus sp. HI0068]KZY81210.1 hypothetical protein A3741_17615 [Oleiphilus sp. HI0069]KZZ31395.1 hypothetical protein A3755_11975 [Oleiphilus sp. HI0085]KZZ74763.1 hypothetical protein A3766_17935 [Oleiphilus sp. HI0132]
MKMIPVEQYAEIKGISTEKAIEMIRDGSYVGRLVEKQWYVYSVDGELSDNQGKIDPDSNDSNPIIVAYILFMGLGALLGSLAGPIGAIFGIIVGFILTFNTIAGTDRSSSAATDYESNGLDNHQDSENYGLDGNSADAEICGTDGSDNYQ